MGLGLYRPSFHLPETGERRFGRAATCVRAAQRNQPRVRCRYASSALSEERMASSQRRCRASSG